MSADARSTAHNSNASDEAGAQHMRWRLELAHGQACGGCGRPVDASQILWHLERALQEADTRGYKVRRAALQLDLEARCYECLERGAQENDGHALLQTLAQRRRQELHDYWHSSPAFIEGNPRIREPQRDAYFAQRDYFAREPSLAAVVEIPTGCGKTGIICTAPFGVARGRVLVLTPNLTIKRGVERSLRALDSDGQPSRDNFYLKCGVFAEPHHLPRFVSLSKGLVNREDCLRADMVISNVQQMARWLRVLDNDFFDFIIVDEAHHDPASTWQIVGDHFSAAKKLLLTATPERADGKALSGETVYRYKLSQAISNGYVKNVVRVDAVAAKLTFSVADEQREFSSEEILAMREESWFSKGVALSPLCNATIVEAAIAIWDKKRQSGVGHQLIGAACSIRHAQQIVELFNARGVAATHVASEGMSMEERLARIKAFERGDFPCIVHVGILGEGYDNPNISVAAIFRPYRSLAPYAQFVGRAIRWIDNGAPPDNLAHIVSHVGLNLGFLWEYFKAEARDAAFMASVETLFFKDTGQPIDTETLEMELTDEEEGGTQVTSEELAGYDVDTFLPCPGEREQLGFLGPILDGRDAQVATARGRAFQTMGQNLISGARRERVAKESRGQGRSNSEPALRPPRESRAPLKEKSLELPFGRPDVERAQARSWLGKEVQRAAGYALWALKLPPIARVGELLGEILPEGEREGEPYGLVIRALNRVLNAMLGKEPSGDKGQSGAGYHPGAGRNEWGLEELQTARQMVGAARERVMEAVRRALQNRDQLKLELF